MRIAIAMTTFNGEKYIRKQMDSIYNQTRRPDEVIICDDCSNDNTVATIKKFIEIHNLDGWKLILNSENKGWQHNFLDAIGMTTGDIIFCADQDDIWLPDKIEYMSEIMEKNAQILCLSGGYQKIDSENNLIMDDSIKAISEYRINTVDHLLFSNKVNEVLLLGCTLCFRRLIANYLKQMCTNEFSHDSQICRLSMILDGMYITNKKVIQYRIHDKNTSGIKSGNVYGISNISSKIEYLKANIEWLNSVSDFSKTIEIRNKKYKIDILNDIYKMQQKRLSFYQRKNLIKFLGLLKYLKHYRSLSTWVGDFCYAYGFQNIGGKILYRIKHK